MLFFISPIGLSCNRTSSLLPALLHAHLIFQCCHFRDSTFCHLSVFSVSENLSKPICPAWQTPEWSLLFPEDTGICSSHRLFWSCLTYLQGLKLHIPVMTTLPKLSFICRCLNKDLLLVHSCSNRAPILISAFQKSLLLLSCCIAFQQISCWSHHEN